MVSSTGLRWHLGSEKLYVHKGILMFQIDTIMLVLRGNYDSLMLAEYKYRRRIRIQVTIYRRILIGRDGHLDQSESYDISSLVQ